MDSSIMNEARARNNFEGVVRRRRGHLTWAFRRLLGVIARLPSMSFILSANLYCSDLEKVKSTGEIHAHASDTKKRLSFTASRS